MAKDPAFLFFYKDILVSCADWDADVLGWYVRLLSHQADKPEGLPADLESLAALACVKFSQFDRFSQCWKRTLEAKFTSNAKGLLVNEIQEGHLSKRRNHKINQAVRGLVGSYVKKMKSEGTYTPHQIGLVSARLFDVLSPENSKEENNDAYKLTLEATLTANAKASEINNKGNVNGNVNTNANGCYDPDPEMQIPQRTLEAAEANQFSRTGAKHTAFVQDNWKVFLLERRNDTAEMKLSFRSLDDFTRYFLNWIRTKHPQNGTESRNSPARKPGTSEARVEAARNF